MNKIAIYSLGTYFEDDENPRVLYGTTPYSKKLETDIESVMIKYMSKYRSDDDIQFFIYKGTTQCFIVNYDMIVSTPPSNIILKDLNSIAVRIGESFDILETNGTTSRQHDEEVRRQLNIFKVRNKDEYNKILYDGVNKLMQSLFPPEVSKNIETKKSVLN